jgi:ketosteroid isomerase-like protein
VEVVVTSPLEDRLRTELREEADAVELRGGFVETTVDQVFVRRRHRRIRTLAVAASVIVILALSGVVLASQTQDDSSPPVIDRVTAQTLRQTEQSRLAALVAADMPVLQRLYADDFELITPTGTPLARDELLGLVADGEFDFRAFEPVTPIEVRLYGDAAVLRYQSRIDIVAGKEQRNDGAWHTCLYESRDGDWRIVREQTTVIVTKLPPDS